MLIGSYGLFWDRDKVDFAANGWRLLGRQGLNTGTLRITDFRRARGVYVLYNDVGVYYVGLAAKSKGIGGRIKDHLKDEHQSGWTRFSWFSFDDPSDECYADGVHLLDQYDAVEVDSPVLIRDLEALLQAVTQPFACKAMTKFAAATEWIQVATCTPQVKTFDDLKNHL